MYLLTVLLSFDYLVLLICLVVVCLGQQTQKKQGQPDLCYSTGDLLYFVLFNHCYILFVYTVYSRPLRPFTFHPNRNNISFLFGPVQYQANFESN